MDRFGQRADRRAHILERAQMRAFGRLDHRRVRFHQCHDRARFIVLGDRSCFDVRMRDTPAAGPKRRGRIVQRVHDDNHGMTSGPILSHVFGREIAERRALENVAVVEQQAIQAFPTRLSDQRGRLCQPERFVGTITKIVVRIEAGVQIRDTDEAQVAARRGACNTNIHIVLAQQRERVATRKRERQAPRGCPSVPAAIGRSGRRQRASAANGLGQGLA